MALLNAPFGFRPATHKTALGRTTGQYSIASALSADIAIGDLVKSTGTGKNITKAAAGDTILGVFAGYYIDRTNQGSSTDLLPWRRVWTSGTTYTGRCVALVYDDPHEIFEVIYSGTLAAGDVGAFCNLVDASYDTAFGRSKQTVNIVGSDSQFKIQEMVEVAQRIDDGSGGTAGYTITGYDQYSIIKVIPAKHERGGTSTAVAT
jgi:hypothetical protein